MAKAVQTATRFKYPISGEALARLLTDEARHASQGGLERRLSAQTGVREIAYDMLDGEGAIYFTVPSSIDMRLATDEVSGFIDTYLKDLK